MIKNLITLINEERITILRQIIDKDLEENFNQIYELTDNGVDPEQKPSDLKNYLIEEK